MSPWRLDVVLRIRTGAQERAAVAHGRAVAARIRMAAATDAARIAWEAARRRALGATDSVFTLQRAGDHLRQLARDAERAEASLGAALRAEQTSRDALLRARRDQRMLSSLRDQEERRSRRARDAALEDELMEHGAWRGGGLR